MQRDYISKNHSKFLLKYHIILVCKYRKCLLVGEVAGDMKKILLDIALFSDFEIEVLECDKDHIHLLVSSPPKLSPLEIVRRLKQMSTIAIWKLQYRELRKKIWKHRLFWTDGYFVASTGNVSQETVRKYIESQG